MSTYDLVRFQDAAVPLTDAAAAQADNYSAQTALYATHKRILALQETLADMPIANVDGKSGKTIFVTKTSGGEYASLQAAVDAAVAGDVVVVGAGSWGPVTLKAGVSLMGLQPPLADEVVLSKLTFAPTSGSAATNTVYVSNLRISSNTNESSLVLGGTFPVRVTMSGVRVYRNLAGATVPMASCVSAVGDTTTSIYMRDCMFTHEGGQVASSITLLSSSARYLDLNNCIFFEGGRSLDVTAGGVVAAVSRFETNSTVAALRVGASCRLSLGSCLVANTVANASGVELVAATSVLVASNTGFNVTAGTGKAVLASAGGTFLKGNVVANPGTNSSVSAGVLQVPLTAVA